MLWKTNYYHHYHNRCGSCYSHFYWCYCYCYCHLPSFMLFQLLTEQKGNYSHLMCYWLEIQFPTFPQRHFRKQLLPVDWWPLKIIRSPWDGAGGVGGMQLLVHLRGKRKQLGTNHCSHISWFGLVAAALISRYTKKNRQRENYKCPLNETRTHATNSIYTNTQNWRLCHYITTVLLCYLCQVYIATFRKFRTDFKQYLYLRLDDSVGGVYDSWDESLSMYWLDLVTLQTLFFSLGCRCLILVFLSWQILKCNLERNELFPTLQPFLLASLYPIAIFLSITSADLHSEDRPHCVPWIVKSLFLSYWNHKQIAQF